ncbi:MAG: TonB-dependent receptor [Candidatus Acidiferrales bacterium]
MIDSSFRPKFSRLALALLLAAGLCLPLMLQGQTAGEIHGRVQTLSAEGEPLALLGVSVLLESASDPAVRFTTETNDIGAFSFAAVPPGSYRLTATLESYLDATQELRVNAGARVEVTLTLGLRPVQEEVTVRGETEGVQLDQTASEQQIAGATLLNAPLVSERFIDALPLVPGVVRGPDGLVKIKGASTTQTGWIVNSANVTDPVTGEQAIALPVDVIEEVDVLPNPYAAEYGKFAGAVTNIETKPSSDKYKFSLNNFIPRLRRREGGFRGVESATPRFTLSGPLVPGKLAFLQSFEYRLNRLPVTSLPELERDTDLESFDSFTQLDATLSPTHTFAAVFSAYPQKQRYANLDTFNPQPVTANYRQRGWMAAVRDRAIFNDGSLLESTFSLKDFDVDIFAATPGPLFTLRPDRNFDSYFNNQNRVSRRYEWVEVFNFAPQQARGQHLFKLGFVFSRDLSRGLYQGRTVEVRRADDTLAERIEYIGDPLLDRDKSEFSAFFHDKWSPLTRLTLDFGLRYDFDTLAEEHNFAPRLAFALVLTSDNKTLLRGGAGLFYDKVPLNVGTFDQLPQRRVTLFAADGLTLANGPRLFENRLTDLENPRSLAFNLELDREITPTLLLRLGYLQREGRDEYIVEPFEDLGGVPVLELAARGRSRYREGQVTLNYRFREDSFFNLSYVHAESAGDLNAFQDFFGNFTSPIIRANERSRLRHDVPDRVLLWGEIGLPFKVRWAPVLDVHSGYAFSLLDETQNFVGARNHGGRFPAFASFDSQFYRDFKIKVGGKKRTVRVGIKIFNILNHFNPRDVQQNLDASNALGFFNSRGRLYRGKFSIDF